MRIIKNICILLALTSLYCITLPLKPYAAAAADITDEARADGYFRWFGIYDDYNQIEIETAEEIMRQLIEEGESSMTFEETAAMLGAEGYEESVGESKFLRYYSMNDEQSLLLYVQFFLEEDEYTLYSIEAQNVSEQFFESFNLKQEEIDNWQKTDTIERQIKTYDNLAEILGTPSIINYNYKHEVLKFAWERDSVVFPEFNYIEAETDAAGNLTLLKYIE